MPFINVKTNINIENKDEIKEELGKLISILPGKSETWLMVDIEDNKNMYFKGSNDPLMMVEVKIYGSSNEKVLNDFTSKTSSYLSSICHIPQDRIYISYFSTPYWGYDGENF